MDKKENIFWDLAPFTKGGFNSEPTGRFLFLQKKKYSMQNLYPEQKI